MIAVVVALALTAGDAPFGTDKALHFSASFAISAAAYAGAALTREPVEGRLAAAVGVALFAGAAKELLDTQTRGDFSLLDLGWDVAGAVTGAIVSWLVDRFVVQPLLARGHRLLEAKPPGLTAAECASLPRGVSRFESPAR